LPAITGYIYRGVLTNEEPCNRCAASMPRFIWSKQI
jgi:hypothetical protein